ncbi:Outer membrane protein assembly factor BamA [Saccharicrinis carchari]|uniref:Outer membrane protein assembly factor BamA n=2 Tax=Saccharicrinis carchari TaxID=1168039 RepID=A0A521E336_SACCC|nr:Outer membrane protein assembly factor BamA [Saccharicrinis carchari]
MTVACSSVKNVPEDAYLLKRAQVKNNPRSISKDRFKPFIKQNENLRIFGILKFHLGLYNLAGSDTTKGLNRWLRRVGEAPVLYDSLQARQSAGYIETFLKNKGYFHAHVHDSLVPVSKKKAKVVYNIQAGNRFKINQINYGSEDTVVGKLVIENQKNSLLKEGRPFDVAVHDAERQRITHQLRNMGYYNFSKEFIYYRVDSSIGDFLVNDSIIIKNQHRELYRGKDTTYAHNTYRIKDVFFRMGYDTHRALSQKDDYFELFDTLQINNCHFLYVDKVEVNPDVLYNSSYILPGQLFRADLVDRTQSLLSSLKLYRYVNIRFEDASPPDTANANSKWLDCHIQLIPAKHQSYSIDIEGINSSGNLGAGGNFKYQHKNLFKGAEEFSFSFGASMQNQNNRQGLSFSTIEIGGESDIVYPKFWMPFKIPRFRQRYNPKTSLSLAYSYQRRPDYTRTIANGKISYLWKANKHTTHVVTPLSVNLVRMPVVEVDFWNLIKDTYLRFSYEDHLISSTAYSIVYNEQQFDQRKNFWYANLNVEESGNVLDLAARAFGKKVTSTPNENGSTDTYYEVMGIRYAQFVQSNIDIRYHHYPSRISSMAYRFYLGVGYPYGNLAVLPFEKRYFAGGANSIRAWPVRGLGPGSYNDPNASYYNQTGDIKLEMNAEYRFKLFWVLEGALFLDVGNIYTIRKDISPDENALFKFKNFTDKLAVGTGLGLRFDVKYFVFRFDTGLKLRDPMDIPRDELNPNGPLRNKWIMGSRPYTWDDVAFNFAIGYPF